MSRFMRMLVFFDLPVMTKPQRRAATAFRNFLLKDGYVMMQYSVYVRHCPSKENADVHVKRVNTLIPIVGQVSILSITDKQYGDIINYNGKVIKSLPTAPRQLELF